MTDDRKTLADRLEALCKHISITTSPSYPNGLLFSYSSAKHFDAAVSAAYDLKGNLPTILATLRQPSADDAFRRGAEAMREAAAECADRLSNEIARRTDNTTPHEPRGLYEDEIGDAIRALPIPEPKP